MSGNAFWVLKEVDPNEDVQNFRGPSWLDKDPSELAASAA
jgi:hypothetical protein